MWKIHPFAMARLDHQMQKAVAKDPSNPFWNWVLENFDADEYATLQSTFTDVKFGTQSKFFDVLHYLPKKLGEAKQFDRRSRVLDLGCGAGHLGLVGSYIGHDVLGLDVPGQLCFDAQCAFWKSRKVEHTIKAFTPLPDHGTFNIVCSYLTKFGEDWGRAEWDFFIDDCLSFSDRLIVDLPSARVEMGKYLGARCSKKLSNRKFVFK